MHFCLSVCLSFCLFAILIRKLTLDIVVGERSYCVTSLVRSSTKGFLSLSLCLPADPNNRFCSGKKITQMSIIGGQGLHRVQSYGINLIVTWDTFKSSQMETDHNNFYLSKEFPTQVSSLVVAVLKKKGFEKLCFLWICFESLNPTQCVTLLWKGVYRKIPFIGLCTYKCLYLWICICISMLCTYKYFLWNFSLSLSRRVQSSIL